MIDTDRYVLIIEHKAEQPLVWEQALSKGTYAEVHERMKAAIASPSIIRVAMAKLVYETGHEELLK